MRYRDGRRSLCLSSQSGCPLTCTFCATGQMRFGRNLTASEILDQALHFRRIGPVDHAVFMGMGEPMMNLDAVLEACAALPDLGISHRRTAISTVGWMPGIERLAAEPMPIRLALSLHAADEQLRSQLMPVNDRYPLADVLAACRELLRAQAADGVRRVRDAGRASTTRYAQARAARAGARPAGVQGQPDPVQPDRLAVRRARARRRSRHSGPSSSARGSRATVRLTRGRDIDAACGQLAAAGAALARSPGGRAINPQINPCADDGRRREGDPFPMSGSARGAGVSSGEPMDRNRGTEPVSDRVEAARDEAAARRARQRRLVRPLGGRTSLDHDVQERLVALAVATSARPAEDQPDDLTPRETKVLTLIAEGLSNREIAERLVVSNATVKTHVNRIFAKIGARDRAQAVRFAYERGLSGRAER